MAKPTREQALQWRDRYDAGATIEQLALDAGIHTGTMRLALHSVDTVMRPPGQRPGSKGWTNRNEPQGSLPRVGTSARARGHRRRARYF